MIIDAYTHMVHPSLFDSVVEYGGDWGESVIEVFGPIADNRPQLVDVDVRLDQLDDTAIDRQVITPPGRFDANRMPADADRLGYAREVNDTMAELAGASDGRLIGIGNVPMDAVDGDGRAEMDRALELGLEGFAISTNARGRPADDPSFEAFWAAAEALEVPVWIHPADPPSTEGRPYEDEYDSLHNFGWPYETTLTLTRLVFSGVLDRYPDLDIVSHHMGGMIPFFLGRTVETFKTPRGVPELPRDLDEYFAMFHYDTAVGGSTAAIRCGYEEFGASRILFATDAPFGPELGRYRLREYPDVIADLGLPADDETAILSGNIQSILGR